MKPGTVYLLHFSEPYRHARHYVGWTDRPVEERIADHVAGIGARLTAVVTAAGITLTLARTWRGGRKLERMIKRSGGAVRRCPLCTPGTKWGRRIGSRTHQSAA